MPRYVIERDMPGIGLADRKALREAAEKSNGVLAAMKMEQKNIQWSIPMLQAIRHSVFT